MGDQENCVGLAHHPMTNLYVPSLPVCDSRSHGSQAQCSIVVVVDFAVKNIAWVRIVSFSRLPPPPNIAAH